MRHQIVITTVYLLRVQNMTMDMLSRHFSQDRKWEIDSTILHHIFWQWGTFQIDLLIKMIYRKCTQFCSRARPVTDPWGMPFTSSCQWVFCRSSPRNSSDIQNSTQIKKGLGQCYCSDMAQTNMVSLPDTASHVLTDHSPCHSSSPFPGEWEDPSPHLRILHLKAWLVNGSQAWKWPVHSK